MRAYLKQPIYVNGRGQLGTSTLDGHWEDGLFHDHSLRIAVTADNIHYIEVVPSGKPVPVPGNDDIVDAQVLATVNKPKKK